MLSLKVYLLALIENFLTLLIDCLLILFFCRGEKYMGMWEADSRQGPGLVVTLDGIYNQGTFSQNKLTVR